jgi:translation elongation factor EF-1alpha
MMAYALGIDRVIVVITKMDKVKWEEELYIKAMTVISLNLKKTGFNPYTTHFVPISGKKGDNLDSRAKYLTDWYNGPTLLKVLDGFRAPIRNRDAPLRVLVHDAFNVSNSTGVVATGKVITGNLMTNQMV